MLRFKNGINRIDFQLRTGIDGKSNVLGMVNGKLYARPNIGRIYDTDQNLLVFVNTDPRFVYIDN